ncbi:hypothetical protein JG688_00008648 [Phytophthora aleatoria]|uniref:Uncharacterized protein n=1 Tax=Phytophthora aleatoria TaxID=2496075 RepID=A0A8J5J7N6_9STRA|nr:hypothetical protein JG688_00008648 [Phytophthora aleatoria]
MSTYPLRGILYFLGDQHLWRLSVCPVLLTMAVALGAAFTLFTFTLHRQEEELYDAGLSTFFAWLIAVIFVIIEVFIVTAIYGLVTLEWFKDKIFAHVMIERGYRELVENEERHSPFLRVLTSCCRVSILLRLGLLVITLPLNMIPVVGNLTYAWLNGTLMAWEAHLYYFEMKAFDFDQQKEIIAERKLQYSAFGMQAMLLEMIPIAGAIFMFTNAAGAALFAASIEKELEKQERRKNSKWRWGGKNKETKKSHEMDKVPLVNKLGAYVPPYGSTSNLVSAMALFALQGITYFLRHPALWKEVAFPLDVPKQLAEILALSIVMTEIFVSTVVYGAVCVDYFQDKIFTFRARGHLAAIASGTTPILGSLVYAWLHGSVLAWEQHLFYFELKGFGLREQQRWVRCHKVQYSNFGMQALLLHMTPCFGMQALLLHMTPCFGPFFMFTNACGAALLAEKLEREGSSAKWHNEEETLLGSSDSGEDNTNPKPEMPFYALKGVKFFIGHPHLWKQAAFPLLLTLAFSIFSVFLLFAWTLRPQENWMAEKGLPSVLSWIFAVIFVIVEIFLVTLLYAFIVLEYFKDKIFAYVLREKGYAALVERETQESAVVRVCSAFFRLDAIFHVILLIVSLPLHLIPVIGSIVYAWLHSTFMAWESHLYYFDLKGLGFKQQQLWIGQRKFQYTSFGFQMLLLQMIPLVGPLFIFSNTCGAALLAIKMEREGGDKWVDEEDDEALLSGKKTGVYGTV